MGRAVAIGVTILIHVSTAIALAATPATPNGQRSIFEDNPADDVAAPVTVMPPSQTRGRPADGAAVSDRSIPKPPVPSAEAQRAAEQLVREVFRSEYADASDAARQSLARKLLAQAPRTDDLAERFVLVRESADAAAAGGDFQAAEHALDHIPANFASDGRDYRLAAYQRLIARPELIELVTQACLDAADRAIAVEQFDAAEQFLQVADGPAAAAAKANPRAFVSGVAAKRNELRTRRATTQRVATAREALKRDPKDPAALAAVGRHTCLVQGDWARGLPMLADSDDPRLKPAAAAELKALKSTDPADQLEAANLWWALRRDFTGAEAAMIDAHTASIYQAIAPSLKGLRKTLAEKRVAELRRAAKPGAPPDELVVAPNAAAPGAATTSPSLPGSRRSGRLIGPSSVVFVCDASGSMLGLPFDLLKIEIRKAVAALEPHQSFNVIFFRRGRVEALSEKELLRADEQNKAAMLQWLDGVNVASNSDPIPALRLALAQRPQMLYLLTDGGFQNSDAVVAELRRSNPAKRTRISTIAFLSPDTLQRDRQPCEDLLSQIATENGGKFKIVLTTDLAGEAERRRPRNAP